MLQINHQRGFTHKSDYGAFATVRLHNNQLAGLGGRNAWVRIESDACCVYRTVRGFGSRKAFPKDGIELDYDTSVVLGIKGAGTPSMKMDDQASFYPCRLTIRRATKWEIIKAHWSHPDPAYRVPLQISILLGGISVGLGMLGAVLGVISLL